MKKTNAQSLKEIVYHYLRENGLETPLNEYRVIQAWNTILGDHISKNTKDLRIYNQVLFATINGASLKSELSMQKSRIVRELNQYVGAQVITHIVIK